MSRSLLDEIAADSEGNRLLDVGIIVVGGKQDDLGGWGVFENLPGGLKSVEERHRDVHHDDVGVQGGNLCYRLVAVFCLADDLDIAL